MSQFTEKHSSFIFAEYVLLYNSHFVKKIHEYEEMLRNLNNEQFRDHSNLCTITHTYVQNKMSLSQCDKNTSVKEYEILRSPGSGASLLKTGQVYNYCSMRGICLLNRAISPTFLPLCPRHSTFHQKYFPPSSPQDTVDSTRCIFLMGV